MPAKKKEPVNKFGLVLAVVFTLLTLIFSFNPKPFLNFGYWGVFAFSLLGSGVLLIPVLSKYFNIYLLALVVACGMAFNDSVSWYLGRHGEMLMPKSKRIRTLLDTLHKLGVWALFWWALFPFPFDITAVLAGYLDFPFKKFFIPAFLGRFIRFVLIGWGFVILWGKV